jgi:hypothetical protein
MSATGPAARRASWLGSVRPAPAILSGLLGLMAASCARSPTNIDITVSADTTVPTIATLRVTMLQPLQPPIEVSNLFRSLLPDTEASAEPFRFPAHVILGVSQADNGTAELTVEGIDYDNNELVLASGTATTTVKREATVPASVLLHAVEAVPTAPDAGGDGRPDAASPDASSP